MERASSGPSPTLKKGGRCRLFGFHFVDNVCMHAGVYPCADGPELLRAQGGAWHLMQQAPMFQYPMQHGTQYRKTRHIRSYCRRQLHLLSRHLQRQLQQLPMQQASLGTQLCHKCRPMSDGSRRPRWVLTSRPWCNWATCNVCWKPVKLQAAMLQQARFVFVCLMQASEQVMVEPIFQGSGLNDGELATKVQQQMTDLYEFFRKLYEQDQQEIRCVVYRSLCPVFSEGRVCHKQLVHGLACFLLL